MMNFNQLGMYINGEWIREDRKLFTVYNKHSDESIAELPLATKEDVILAGKSANETFNQGPMTPNDTYKFLMKVASRMKEQSDSLAKGLVMEVGKTIKEARAEVNAAIAAFIDAAEEAKRVIGETIPVDANPGSENRFAFTLYTPSGPVCAFTPFNAPLNQAAHKIASSIAAGSTVVLKTNPSTPLSTIHLVDIMHNVGMPNGLVNLVLGDADVGRWLVEDECYAHFTFTGSPKVGMEIRANSNGRPVTLELGSNAPTIVHEDADLDEAASAILSSGFAIAGQVCTSVQRALIHRNVFTEFSYILTKKVNEMTIGDPMNIETDMGPMLTNQAAQKAEEWLNEAVGQGAKILTGGSRKGKLFSPTLVTNVNSSMKIVCQEIFSPIINIIPYDDIDEAINIANDSPYGLQAGIFTSNIDIAFMAARRLRYGGIIINDASRYRVANMPYGGLKQSGIGKEGAKYAIRQIRDKKSVVIKL